MAQDFPIDEGNFSFGDDDYGDLFTTQFTFCNVDTERVNEAVKFSNEIDGFDI